MDSLYLQKIVPADFAGNSRVWVYQSTRPFTEAQEKEIDEQLYHFYAQWKAHEQPVKGWGKVLLGRFIILMADENVTPVSGCSTDSSVRVIKSIERQYDCNLFDRLSITFLKDGKPEVLPLGQVQYAVDNGFINGDTLIFNNLVQTKEALMHQWLQPLKESWLKDRIHFHKENEHSSIK